MNILILDTATSIEIVAIRYEGTIADKSSATQNSHSVTLFSSIDDACKELGITIHDINCIAVGIGPGSFTGIRIAVTTARMLAQILEVPLVGIHTQMLYACSIVTDNVDCIVAFDAKKSRVFAARYRIQQGKLPEVVIPPGDYPIKNLCEIDANRHIIAIGDGALKYNNEMIALAKNITFLPDFLPQPEAMFTMIENLYSGNPQKYADYHQVVPFYSRKSDAEIMKELKNK